jgi:acetyltransferase-like isoleucine patch superfamily enzyme
MAGPRVPRSLRALLARALRAAQAEPSDPAAEGRAWADARPPEVTLGAGVRVLGRPRVRAVAGARIELAAGVVLNSNPDGYHAGMPFPVTLLADRAGARISIGEGSRLHGCCIHAWSAITLGRRCLVAAGAQLLDAHGHAAELRYARVRTRLRDEPEPIHCGDHVWIGLGALVLKGARLGEGCAVAAHSVVAAGEYPPFSLLAGAPARVVQTLDPGEVLAEDAALRELSHLHYEY